MLWETRQPTSCLVTEWAFPQYWCSPGSDAKPCGNLRRRAVPGLATWHRIYCPQPSGFWFGAVRNELIGAERISTDGTGQANPHPQAELARRCGERAPVPCVITPALS